MLRPLQSPEYLDLLCEDLQNSCEGVKENIPQSSHNSVTNSFGGGHVSVPQLRCDVNCYVDCICSHAEFWMTWN